MIPQILVNKFISEIYPFTEEEISTYRGRIDFQYLSKNKNIQWSFGLLKRFEELWDWKALEANRAVFKRLSLGLLFPDKAKVLPCNCFRHMDFCEMEECFQNWNKFNEATSLKDDFPEMFFKMQMFLESGAVDSEMIKSYYNSNDPGEVIKFDFDFSELK